MKLRMDREVRCEKIPQRHKDTKVAPAQSKNPIHSTLCSSACRAKKIARLVLCLQSKIYNLKSKIFKGAHLIFFLLSIICWTSSFVTPNTLPLEASPKNLSTYC